MNWLRNLFRRKQMTADLSEELRQHLDEKIESFVAAGMPREDAVHAARRAFGNATLLEQRSCEVWMWPFLESLWADVKFAFRQLRKAPGFTLTVILTLALGIGATAAIFSLVDGVLLRPLPFPQQNRLLWLAEAVHPNGASRNVTQHFGQAPLSYPDFFDWRAKNHTLAGIASYRTDNFTLIGRGDARELTGAVVSAGFFRVLGIVPAIGNGFQRNDEANGFHVVVLSHQLWQSVFNSDPNIVGKNIQLGGVGYRVAGVMPKAFQFPIQTPAPAFWVSLAVDGSPGNETTTQRGAHMLHVIGRLKPGVSLAQAQADLNVVAAALAMKYPDTNTRFNSVVVQPELNHLVGNSAPALRVLFGAVILLLLIACANVAGLLLSRGVNRRREMAIRAALGASRATILWQMIVESLVLSCAGGALGFGLSFAMLRALLLFVPGNLPRLSAISIDGSVLAFAIVASLLTGLLFGILPAWRLSRLDPDIAMHEDSRVVAGGRGQRRFHDWLVVAETAITLVLLVASGLLIRSFVRVMNANPGFDSRHVLTANLDLPDNRYSTLQQIQFYRELLSQVAQQPGVRSVAAGWPLPLSGHDVKVEFSIQGRPVAPGQSPNSAFSVVTPDYFQTMRIPLLGGRTFRDTDKPAGQPVMIVSESFARKFFAGQDPIGKEIQPEITDQVTKLAMRTIVGVVGDVKRRGLTAEVEPQFYLPYAQAAVTAPSVVLRTATDPVAMIAPLRATVARMDRNVPVYDARTLDSSVNRSASQARFQMLLLVCFAGLALLLAAIGLYGVLSYMVVQQTLEIGVRMAMGAQRSQVLGMVLRRGMTLALTGLGIGLVLSVLLTRFVAGMLYRVHPLDWVTFLGVTLVLLIVSLLACSLPARRAASIDPMQALRAE